MRRLGELYYLFYKFLEIENLTTDVCDRRGVSYFDTIIDTG